MSSGLGRSLANALADARAPLLFGVRLWASVCLALFVAFWLQLDEPFWAGTSAAVVCQPQLGASLRKGWFRMIGTVIGAVTIVVLTACFPQDRIAFFALLALWGGICAFVATVLRNFASYAAALAGYTAAIVAADTLGATGGASSEVFMLAIFRASEICIGIVCAGIVLAGTDLGGAQRRLAASLADLAADIAGGFTRMLALAGPQLPDTQAERRELVRRVIELDPMIDQALGESSHLRYRSTTLQTAVHGLFAALAGWRGVATHLRRLPDDVGRQSRGIDPDRASRPSCDRRGSQALAKRWMADPVSLQRVCEEAERTLLALTTDTPSRRLLADETAKVLNGMVRVLDGLALLVDAPGRPPAGYRNVRPGVADWLPAVVNGARAFVTIGAVELLWVATAWPNGGSAIVFVTIVLLLLSPKGDLAYVGALAFALTAAVGIVAAAIIRIRGSAGCRNVSGLLRRHRAFLHTGRLCRGSEPDACTDGRVRRHGRHLHASSLTHEPDDLRHGAILQYRPGDLCRVRHRDRWHFVCCRRSRQRCGRAGCSLSPCATCGASRSARCRRDRRIGSAGCTTGSRHCQTRPNRCSARSFWRRCRSAPTSITFATWFRALGRPRSSTPRSRPSRRANSTAAIARLHQLDRRLASDPDTGPETDDALRVRGRIVAISEVLAEHGSYFDSGAPA